MFSYSLTTSCQKNELDTLIEAELDSLINEYERSYRTHLNKSDTLLISSLTSQLELDCTSFDHLINQNIYSNTFLATLTSSLITKDVCLKEILDNLLFYRPINEPLHYENFPISLGATHNNTTITKVTNYLLESEYLSDCKFLSNKSDSYLNKLSIILQKSAIADNQIITNCKSANLFILRNYYVQK